MIHCFNHLLWYLLFLYLSYNTVDIADAFAIVTPPSNKLLMLHQRTLPCYYVTPIPSRRMSMTSLYASENEEREELKDEFMEEEERLQRDLDKMMMNASEQDSFGFNPDNFDETKLPVPLFTGLVVMAFSLYLTGYFLYVGINGFPEGDTPFPRPF